MRTAIVVVTLSLCLRSTLARAQLPPPVSLQIQNIPQETVVWCWAAVAQQIIAATRGPASTPAQCALVAMANGVPPQACCVPVGDGMAAPGTMNPLCVRTGSIGQIQQLIRGFGGRATRQAPPTDPLTLYRTLAAGRAVILQLVSGPGSAHVVVLRGMSFGQDMFGNVSAVLEVNDPLAQFTQPVPYQQVMGSWMSAIVVDAHSSLVGAGTSPMALPDPVRRPAGASGASMSFEVTRVEGLDVEPGGTCSATVSRTPAGRCRMRVTCGGLRVYGRGSGGIFDCDSPGQSSLRDDDTSAVDQDPAFEIDRETSHVEIRDDESGALGEFRLVGRLSAD